MLRENFPEFAGPRGDFMAGRFSAIGPLIILISFSILFLTLYVGTGFTLDLEARKGNGAADDRTLGAAGRRESRNDSLLLRAAGAAAQASTYCGGISHVSERDWTPIAVH